MQMIRMAHLDSNQVAFLQRELEAVDAKTYEDLLPGYKARTYIPDYEGIPPYAESILWKMYTRRGKARKIGKNTDALPRVNLTATPQTRRIEQEGLSYGWTVREIKQAAATGVPLDQMTVLAARTAAAKFIDDMLAIGNGSDIPGLLTNTAVATVTPTTKTGGVDWQHAGNTPDQAMADVNKILSAITTDLRQTDAPGFDKYVVLIPPDQFTYLSTTARATNSDTTLLTFLLKNNPWLESIEPWWQCKGIGAGGTDRMVAYPRNPLAVAGIVPTDFDPLPPQERNLEIVVPVTASCGGTVIRYPVAVRYMDGI